MDFENYSIRLVKNKDLQLYYQLIERNRERLEDFFAGTISRTQTKEQAKVFLAELVQQKKEKKLFPFIVFDNEQDIIIAYICFKNIDWSIPKAEVGVFTDVAYAGRGITSKVLESLLSYCAKEYTFKKFFLRTYIDNNPARKLAEKCGFEIEGIMKKDHKRNNGEIVDLVYYGKVY